MSRFAKQLNAQIGNEFAAHPPQVELSDVDDSGPRDHPTAPPLAGA